MAKAIPEKSSVVRKEYKNAISRGLSNEILLDFTLRQDTPDEMIGFLYLLKQATAEVEEDLAALQSRRKAKAGKK